jgi:hypothetical protein
VANGEMMASHKQVTIPLAPQLSSKATQGHVFKDLTSGPLLSIGRLCDDDCIALFSKKKLHIFKNDTLILEGKRNSTNGLWSIPLNAGTINTAPNNPDIHMANSVIQNVKTKQDLAQFYHTCNFSLVPSTFISAIKQGHFIGWPGPTVELIQKHLPKSIATSRVYTKR